MIGRKEEQKYLLSLIEEEEPQFVAVFGRRIGKTYLIRETFKHEFTFQHTCVSNNQIEPGKRKEIQLEKLSESLKEYGYQACDELKTWNDAFNALKKVIKASEQEKNNFY